MPIERFREQFKAGAEHFYALGRNKEPARSMPGAAAPEVITVSSTATTASTRSTGDLYTGLPTARARPLILSDDDEETDQEEESETGHDSEIEILSSPPVQPQPRSQPIKTTGVVSQPRPLQPLNGVHRNTPAIGLGTPIHIPSNKDLYKPPTRIPAQRSSDVSHITNPGYTQAEPPLYDNDPHDFMGAKETETALKELISGSMNENDSEIDPSDKIVEGFKKEFSLLDHQVIGRKWMTGREDVQAKKYGGILADDMGLGKTIQTLARVVDNPATADDRSDGWAKSTLVVCPLALVGQWADEIKRMTSLTVTKHQGTSRTTDPFALSKHRVVITTYETVASEYAAFSPAAKDESKGSKAKSQATTSQLDSDSDEAEHFGRRTAARTAASKRKTKSALFQIRWFRIVLDEAHNIKNHSTKRSIACCELEGRFRWCLTGTPLQNNVGELYPLLKFLKIRPWNSQERFNRELAKPIQGGRGAVRAMKRLQFILQQIMLRRRKDDMLNGKKLIELPKRTVEIISCPFDSSEQTFYDALESKMSDVLEDIMKEKEGSKYMSVLLLLLRLRQACNHPLLVTKDYKKDLEAVDSQPAKKDGGDVDADDLAAAFEQLGVTRKCQMCTVVLSSANAGQGKWSGHCLACVPLAQKAELAERDRPTSAKIRMILKLLREIEERSKKEEKTIIFSQFTSMLDLIEPFLKEMGIRFVRYDGSMSPVDREAALVKIKSNPDVRVILISFKAGSTGLNLTACNNVILVDMWWNPALEDQAFDRAHRFGQTRDVNIFKLKVDNTVEERILLLQDNKRALAQAALSGDKLKNMKLGMDDLLALFRPSGRDDDDDDDE